MPSPFPRLSLVITQEQHHLLNRLAALQGRSAASYVRRLIELAEPSLHALLEPLEALEAHEEQYDRQLQRHISDELDQADRDLANQLALFDPFDDDDAAERTGPERPQLREDAPDRTGSRRLPRAANS